MGKAPEESKGYWAGWEANTVWFGVGAALLSRRSKHFPELSCLQVGEEPEKS